ncbi:DinB family protein [Mucilaginibacter sp. BT774]|uniref:DinB family protein n=1 Tax=Mucilaginibacter sp. BT774 TaxID=3062276 RepID=UPI0026750EA2|nr:DinB family protein [Mucilaginibacter sp. BT774]MDO3628480.1 DinB family protein [Mucilaginibacter sp. BT774]
MKKLALLFTLLIAFVGVNAQTKDQMIADWQRAKNYTKAYLDAMPEDGYGFKPTPEMRSFAGQMLHLADGNYFLVGAIAGKPGPLGKESAEKTVAQTKEATTKATMDSYDYVIAALQNVTSAQLQDMVKVAGKDITKQVGFNKAFEHQTHHRGQTTVYLRLKGVTPPGEMLF